MEIFKGKRALVTGCGRGMGRATALELAKLGAEVYGLDIIAENLETLKEENSAIHTTLVDLADWESTRKAVQDVLPIHLLVNNAGTSRVAHCLNLTSEEFDIVFNVNVKAILNITQVVAADLIERGLKGSIVNFASAAGHNALREHAVYSPSKAAVIMMTKCFALELGQHGIRVNAVSPTVVMTVMSKTYWADPAKSGPLLSRIPQGRFVEVEDVVNAVIYLLSDKSDMINGHSLPVEGGLLTN